MEFRGYNLAIDRLHRAVRGERSAFNRVFLESTSITIYNKELDNETHETNFR